MNAPAMNLNPVQPQRPSGTASERAASDPSGPPFSEVLSGEMANSRKDGAAAPSAEARADASGPSDTPTQAEDAATGAGSSSADQTASEPVAADPASAAAAAALPLPLIAAGRGDSAAADDTDADLRSTLGAHSGQSFALGRKGRAPLEMPSGQAGDRAAAGARKPDLAPSLKADAQASAKLAASLAFTEQLAGSRKTGAPGAVELSAELSGATPRAAPHTAFETLAALRQAAAPALAPQVGSAAWNQALGEKIVWMAGAAQQSATLTLNPPHMGPLQVVIELSSDQATASFFSAQPEVRQALEAAFPRLREMMNEAGIELGQATVSSETPQQNEREARPAHGTARLHPESDDVQASLQTGQLPIRQSRGLIDTFA